jgi:hypothetical protein
MKPNIQLGCLAIAFMAACASVPATTARLQPHGPGDFTYGLVRVPEAWGASRTLVERANARGDLVGRYMADSTWHGFVRRNGSFEKIDVPGATQTFATGINEAGEIVGRYTIGKAHHGFRLAGGSFTTVDAEGATATHLYDVADNGLISGSYRTGGGKYQPAIWIDGRFTPLPDIASALGADMAEGFGVGRDGRITGHFTTSADPKMYGFVYDRRTGAVKLNHPGSSEGKGSMSCGAGVGAGGEVVGHYTDSAAGGVSGFIWTEGRFVGTLRVPAATETYPASITASGMIVGAAILQTGERVGFTAVLR